jgi:hypothetical protein
MDTCPLLPHTILPGKHITLNLSTAHAHVENFVENFSSYQQVFNLQDNFPPDFFQHLPCRKMACLCGFAGWNNYPIAFCRQLCILKFKHAGVFH